MKRLAPPSLAALTALGGLLSAPLGALAADTDWYLFSRHGECSSIAVLNRKLPDVGDANSPDEVARRLRRRGETVELSRRPDRDGELVVMELQKRRMSLMFVTEKLCQATAEQGESGR